MHISYRKENRRAAARRQRGVGRGGNVGVEAGVLEATTHHMRGNADVRALTGDQCTCQDGAAVSSCQRPQGWMAGGYRKEEGMSDDT